MLFPQRFRLLVQSWLHASNNIGILNTCTRLLLTESEQATPVDLIKDVVRSSGKVPEFDKHLKKAGGHISRNVVEITIKMKTIVRKPFMIKIIKLRLINLDNSYWSVSILFIDFKFEVYAFIVLVTTVIRCQSSIPVNWYNEFNELSVA